MTHIPNLKDLEDSPTIVASKEANERVQVYPYSLRLRLLKRPLSKAHLHKQFVLNALLEYEISMFLCSLEFLRIEEAL